VDIALDDSKLLRSGMVVTVDRTMGMRSGGGIGYLFAGAVTVGALVIRALLDPWLGDTLPYVTLFGAVAFAVWYGGYRPATFAAILGWFACVYWFVPPRRVLELSGIGADDIVGSVLCLLSAGVIIGFGEALMRARRRASEQDSWFGVTLSSVGEGVVTADGHGNVAFMNPVAESLTGWRLADAVGRPIDRILELVDDTTHERIADPLQRAAGPARGDDAQRHTALLVDRTGNERLVEDSVAPIRDTDGSIRGTVLVLRDASAQREAERVLRQNEKDLAGFFENAVVGLHWVADDGTILRTNRTELELMGYTADEYVGRNIAEFHVDAELIADMLRRLRAGETIVNQQAQLRRKDGSIRTVRLSSNALWEDGKFVHSQCITQDISAQLIAESASRHLAAIVESSEDAIVAKSLDGIVVSWNRGAERVFGYTQEEMVGRPITVIIPPEHAHEEPAILDRIRRGERVESYESIRRRKDGSLIAVSLMISPIRDQDGNVIGASKIARDITHLKKIERELRDADRRKDEFLAVLAHELRNPLAPIRQATQVARASFANEARVEWSHDVIDRQVGHMARLLDDLLDIARITRGTLEIRRSNVDLATVVEAALEMARPLIDARRHTLTVDLPDDPVALDADPLRLSQVIANLLTNAAKYTGNGGHIALSAERDRGCATIRVVDDGIGLAGESLAQIFEMFAQVGTALDRTEGGLGIGLALSRGLVQLHGGTIEAHSAGLGKGSEFIVRLPLVRANTKSLGAPHEGSGHDGGRRLHILVADDNHDSAESLALFLELNGHTTELVYAGDAAFAAMLRRPPDLALLDIGMPNLNGYELAERVREQPWGGAITLVAITGWGQDGDRARAHAAGFDHHRVKPIDTHDLLALCSTVAVKRGATARSA
jgi:PAS domain S-box-containing protein